LRVLKALADPVARKQWQSAPVAELPTQTGPWLRPQVESLFTILKGVARIDRHSKSEAEISVTLENTGNLPAYPVSVQLLPDMYSAMWSDNYFWLAPGEKVSLQGTARLDMTGLDPFSKSPVANDADLSIRISAWNAPASNLRLR
jgi:hypothetical protein